jgi:hypothetical protein
MTRSQYASKLEELRKKLLGNPSPEELESMKIQTDLLERAIIALSGDHSHDTSEHHDHEHTAI